MIRLAFLEDHSDHYMEDKRRAFIWKVATNVQGRNDDGLDKVEQRNVQIWRLCRQALLMKWALKEQKPDSQASLKVDGGTTY